MPVREVDAPVSALLAQPAARLVCVYCPKGSLEFQLHLGLRQLALRNRKGGRDAGTHTNFAWSDPKKAESNNAVTGQGTSSSASLGPAWQQQSTVKLCSRLPGIEEYPDNYRSKFLVPLLPDLPAQNGTVQVPSHLELGHRCAA